MLEKIQVDGLYSGVRSQRAPFLSAKNSSLRTHILSEAALFKGHRKKVCGLDKPVVKLCCPVGRGTKHSSLMVPEGSSRMWRQHNAEHLMTPLAAAHLSSTRSVLSLFVSLSLVMQRLVRPAAVAF
ncbi:hypothetical protein JOB18_042666 [Solea senegalensis]|uniref:Uncharacterized protein n=1 Tax=Solea senegalensis TaxID=28829 RepID=A0AAV6Q4L3_SOLSE|nr:hypothetical protein JOB18_042666 [Solea senegalensis]